MMVLTSPTRAAVQQTCDAGFRVKAAGVGPPLAGVEAAGPASSAGIRVSSPLSLHQLLSALLRVTVMAGGPQEGSLHFSCPLRRQHFLKVPGSGGGGGGGGT